MTNEQAKEEAIKKAYGDKWDLVKDGVDEIGSIRQFDDDEDACYWMIKIGFNPQDYDTIYSSISPDRHILKSLKNLENNNGWIRIEPDGSNLKEGVFEFLVSDDYKLKGTDGIEKDTVHVTKKLLTIPDWKWEVYSHYKPITPELKPIY